MHSGQDFNWEDYIWPSRSKLLYEDLLMFRDNLCAGNGMMIFLAESYPSHCKNATQKTDRTRARYTATKVNNADINFAK